ncbi:MAG TPA: isopentenyl-diphosphate Delta-isomerase [Pyrinomonadaceae bacterium]|nr:isopentenyl-diphosphate Delta-isomerase [Pyrinomonadaceae bacterium]
MPFNTNVIEGFTESAVRTLAASTPEERVVLVNEDDEAIGIEDKTKAHRLGKLHRAFSVFVVNSAGQLLVQKRAVTKYHSRNLWSNTCCGHPRPGETIAQASRRRLGEEMGFQSNLKEVFSFIYRANLEDGLIENEYDHVLVGYFEGVPTPDPAEISEYRWVDIPGLSVDLQRDPENYTCWFRISFDRFLRVLQPL